MYAILCQNHPEKMQFLPMTMQITINADNVQVTYMKQVP